MRKTKFDYQGAKKAGYSDDEIMQHLSSLHEDFDIQGAVESGYSPEEINQYLSTYKPKKSLAAKAGRVATQYALGAAENALLPYEIGVAPLASKKAQQVPYRENLGEDIENMLLQKQSGVWSEEDENLLQNLSQQMQNPEESEKYIQTADVGVRGLAEKATGLDLQPEGIAEKAANWAGFIKNYKKIAEAGFKPKELMKAIAPTGTEALRGLGAGTALEMAEQGEFGPIGTMASVVIGDLMGAGAAGLVKEGAKFVQQGPKQYLAEKSAKFTPKDTLDLQKEMIKDFRDSGIQADLGTLTNSDLVKWTQSRLAQSGLTGKALDDLKKEMTGQIQREYKTIADSLGEAKYASSHEAGEVAKEGIKKIRESDLAATRQLYQNADAALGEKAFVDSKRLADSIKNIEKQLKPGQLKSTQQTGVLDALEKVKRDLFDSEGNPLYASVKDLMNNKIALNDIINYEVQGGTKQLLKNVVAEIDRAIISHGKENPRFAKNYINANKKFSEHAKTFRNKEINSLLNTVDPAQLMNKMGTVQGIRSLGNILNKSPEGKEIFKNLKRMKLDKAIGDNLVDSTTQQVKMGTFSKLLEKGNNKEIFKEILGAQGFKRLERLQKNAGKLAETAQKFFNSSKTGSTVEDVAIIGKVFLDLSMALHGNPWALAKTVGGITGARYLTRLMADPEFLKLAEEAILASEKNQTSKMMSIGTLLMPFIKSAMDQERQLQSGSQAQSEKNM